MGTATLAALHTTNMQPYFRVTRFNATVIVAMYVKASTMTTGTGQLVELKIRNGIIIKFLRNRIAIIDK